MKVKKASKREFFASANSYCGFKSYFDTIFNSETFDRIFVIKGGPGGGKSTLMKNVARIFEDKCEDIELFRCSSDKNSLDGVILCCSGKSVALIDGTAPHERDAVIPGAVDLLINLGEAFDVDVLEDRKKDIFELNKRKKESYRLAYEKLDKSSVYDSNIKAEIYCKADIKALSVSARDVLSAVNTGTSNEFGIRLFSSFSRDGYTKIDSFKDSDYEVISVVGDYGSDCIFMSILENELIKNGASYVRMPSALDEKTTEGLYLSDSKNAIVCAQNYNSEINVNKFIPGIAEFSFSEKVKALHTCKALYEKEAREALIKASEHHFELEKIYTEAVDFKIINKYTDEITDGISKIFA